jgi:hypothetical protein
MILLLPRLSEWDETARENGEDKTHSPTFLNVWLMKSTLPRHSPKACTGLGLGGNGGQNSAVTAGAKNPTAANIASSSFPTASFRLCGGAMIDHLKRERAKLWIAVEKSNLEL